DETIAPERSLDRLLPALARPLDREGLVGGAHTEREIQPRIVRRRVAAPELAVDHIERRATAALRCAVADRGRQLGEHPIAHDLRRSCILRLIVELSLTAIAHARLVIGRADAGVEP